MNVIFIYCYAEHHYAECRYHLSQDETSTLLGDELAKTELQVKSERQLFMAPPTPGHYPEMPPGILWCILGETRVVIQQHFESSL
jgi:hypothetical protein